MMRSTVVLILFVVICLGAGYLGSFATSRSVNEWYPTIAKPSLNPPDWVFAPVWTTLFVLMGVAAWMVWKDSGLSAARLALAVFCLQLALNVLWSILFFGLQRPDMAFVEILVLWGAILATIWLFLGHSGVGALLLAPYLAWVSFAAYLNYMIWRLNA